MTPLAGQVHSCWKCTRRLNVDNVVGSVAVICPRCKEVNVIQVGRIALSSREQC